MYCDNIALNVPHFTGSKQRKDACFVVTVEPGTGESVLNAVGEAYVDSHSMHYFVDWLQSQRGPLYVLATLDLKFLVMSENLHHILPEDIEQIPLRESERVFANHLSDFRYILEERAAEEPWLYEALKLKQPKLKTRTDFSKWAIFEFDPLAVGLGGLLRPETASISEIAWAYPIAQTYANLDSEYQFWSFHKHLVDRLLNRINVDDPVYDATGLTVAELDRRAQASWHTYFDVQDQWLEIAGEPSPQKLSAWARKVRDIDDAISIAIIAQLQVRLQRDEVVPMTQRLCDFFLGVAFEKISEQSAPVAFDPDDY